MTQVARPDPNLVARGRDADMQTNGGGVAYVRGGQVWYRSVKFRGRRLVRGPERLMSATFNGRPGNGRSGNPALDDRGYYVAFESKASNLCVRQCEFGDSNGTMSDIFRRTMSRHAPTHERMQLVSSTRAGKAHEGPSNNPVISANGENIIFDSTGFFSGGKDSYNSNGAARSLFTWTEPHARGVGNVMAVAPRPHCLTGCKSDEEKPAMSSRGNYVAYLAQMSEFCTGYYLAGTRPDC